VFHELTLCGRYLHGSAFVFVASIPASVGVHILEADAAAVVSKRLALDPETVTEPNTDEPAMCRRRLEIANVTPAYTGSKLAGFSASKCWSVARQRAMCGGMTGLVKASSTCCDGPSSSLAAKAYLQANTSW
jgi:hypothetical protein